MSVLHLLAGFNFNANGPSSICPCLFTQLLDLVDMTPPPPPPSWAGWKKCLGSDLSTPVMILNTAIMSPLSMLSRTVRSPHSLVLASYSLDSPDTWATNFIWMVSNFMMSPSVHPSPQPNTTAVETFSDLLLNETVSSYWRLPDCLVHCPLSQKVSGLCLYSVKPPVISSCLRRTVLLVFLVNLLYDVDICFMFVILKQNVPYLLY